MRSPITAALAASLLLAACGHSPATTFLVLDPTPPAPPANGYAGPPLRVPFLHLPVTLDRPELVRRDGAGTLTVEDFARWSAPLGLMARDTLIQDLIRRLPPGSVLPPDAPAATREIRVEATVLSFEVRDGAAELTASYRLVPTGAAGVRPTVVTLTAPMATDTPPARAQAWSSLIGQLSDRVVDDLPKAR